MDRSLFQLDETGRRVIPSLAKVLSSLCQRNDSLPLGNVTKFHALRPPGVSISEYLNRLGKFGACSGPCYVLSLIYIDRVISRHRLLVNSLNVHRLMISSLMTALKFFDDQFFRNSYYAKLGGVSAEEINALELEFLFLIDFDLHVTSRLYNIYLSELLANNPDADGPPPSPSVYAQEPAPQEDRIVSEHACEVPQPYRPEHRSPEPARSVRRKLSHASSPSSSHGSRSRDEDNDVIFEDATPIASRCATPRAERNPVLLAPASTATAALQQQCTSSASQKRARPVDSRSRESMELLQPLPVPSNRAAVSNPPLRHPMLQPRPLSTIADLVEAQESHAPVWQHQEPVFAPFIPHGSGPAPWAQPSVAAYTPAAVSY